MPRPKLPPHKIKASRVGARLTQSEMALVARYAAERKMTVTEYVRVAVLVPR